VNPQTVSGWVVAGIFGAGIGSWIVLAIAEAAWRPWSYWRRPPWLRWPRLAAADRLCLRCWCPETRHRADVIARPCERCACVMFLGMPRWLDRVLGGRERKAAAAPSSSAAAAAGKDLA
jgi:hypothetical protein